MITWAVGYRFRGKASSQAYWIIWLVVWILDTVLCIMVRPRYTGSLSVVLLDLVLFCTVHVPSFVS